MRRGAITPPPDYPAPKARAILCGMARPRLPSSLRARLFLSYAGLALVVVVLASAASLWLYNVRMAQAARADLRDQATTLAYTVQAVHEGKAIDPRTLAELYYADARSRRWLGPLIVVDAEGTPLLSIYPPPDPRSAAPAGDGAEPSTGIAAAQAAGAPAPTPVPSGPVLRRPRFYAAYRFLPLPADRWGQPAIGSLNPDFGPKLLYVTVPLPAALDRSGPGLEWLDPAPVLPLYLSLNRAQGELRNLWRSLLPSVALVGTLALGLASLVAFVLARSITRPLEALTAASERMAGGDYAAQVAPAGVGELRQLGQSFNGMAHEVGEAHRRQRDFVTHVGHDLRTPLTTIRGFARALVDGTAASEAQRRRAAEAIDAAGTRMLVLIESLTELARLESQRGGMELVACDAAALLARAAAERGDAAALRGVALAAEAPEGLTLWADPAWFGRALGNLIDNAIAHSPPGATVRLAARPLAGEGGLPAEIELSVSDRGSGIAADELPQVFERFYRGDRARRAGGSGLGLSIAREIVEAHGGSIGLDSRPGAGTRVTIRVPASPSGEAPDRP